MSDYSTIFQLIEQERLRQIRGIELIASENYVSDNVLRAMGSILTNKYAEGYPSNRYYGGCEIVDEIELLAIERVKKIFACEYANVQPHSGSQANAALLASILSPGDSILGLDLDMGGHLTHGSSVSFSGIIYKSAGYKVQKDTGRIDYNQVEDMVKNHKPKILICGASAYTRDWDYKTLREIADRHKILLWGDIAHTAGLIAKSLLNDPAPYCHFLTATTHKTLRGPRGGLIMMKHDFENPFGKKDKKGRVKMMSELIDFSVFPGQQGGPLMHVIAAKAIAFGEILSDSFLTYAQNILKNAQSMAQAFLARGYELISGGTDNHLMLVDLRNKNITGKEAATILGSVDITVNKNMLPYDERSPFVTSGIRVGTPAITTRGLIEKDMDMVVEFIDQAFKYKDNPQKLKTIRQEVNQVMTKYPMFKG